MFIDWQPLFERNPSQVLFGKNIKQDEKNMVSKSPSLPLDLGRHTFLRRPDCYASVWRCKSWIRAHRGSGSGCGNQFQTGPKMSKVSPKCQKLWLDWLVIYHVASLGLEWVVEWVVHCLFMRVLRTFGRKDQNGICGCQASSRSSIVWTFRDSHRMQLCCWRNIRV